MMAPVARRYDAYKNSGFDWLGVLPEHWQISHIKRICRNVTDGAHSSPDLSSSDYPFLTVVNLKQGSLDFDSCLYTSRFDYETLVRTGCRPHRFDVLYSKDGTISETCVVETDKEFVVGSSFVILCPRLSDVDSRFLSYLLSSSVMRQQAGIYVRGAGLRRISVANVAKLICLVPPLLEQQTIAAYLDAKTAQIDRKIDLLTQKAAKYRQLKQSLINEAVTRGLDKSAPMNDSGVDWIGEIPAHWELKRVTDIVTKIGNGVTPRGGSAVYTDAGIPFLRSQNVYDDGLRLGDVSFIPLSIHEEMKGSQLKPYDILFNITGASISRTCVVPPDLPPANINQHVAFLRVVRGVDTSFVALFVKSSLIKSYVRFEQNGASKEAFTLKQIADIPLVLPPLGEQRTIVEYLESQIAKIDHIVETVDTQAEKLKELRKALINDVVTGKLRVA